jgi:hypothetical protein
MACQDLKPDRRFLRAVALKLERNEEEVIVIDLRKTCWTEELITEPPARKGGCRAPAQQSCERHARSGRTQRWKGAEGSNSLFKAAFRCIKSLFEREPCRLWTYHFDGSFQVKRPGDRLPRNEPQLRSNSVQHRLEEVQAPVRYCSVFEINLQNRAEN